MRRSTLASLAVLSLSTAALAQVHANHGEQKVGNGNDMEAATNAVAPAANASAPAPADTMSTPDAGANAAAPPAGEPTDATSAPPRG